VGRPLVLLAPPEVRGGAGLLPEGLVTTEVGAPVPPMALERLSVTDSIAEEASEMAEEISVGMTLKAC
jgi:hypothetical protein